jgi:hypothetical protein
VTLALQSSISARLPKTVTQPLTQTVISRSQPPCGPKSKLTACLKTAEFLQLFRLGQIASSMAQPLIMVALTNRALRLFDETKPVARRTKNQLNL